MTKNTQNRTSQTQTRGRDEAETSGTRGQARQAKAEGQTRQDGRSDRSRQGDADQARPGGRQQASRGGAVSQFAEKGDKGETEGQQAWQVEHPEAQTLRLAVDACNAAFAYCTQQDGIEDPELLACMVDCVDLCTTTASFIVRGSEHADDLREVCAELAKCVEESCEEYGDDEVLTACADACREAYDALNAQSTPRVG
jgi:hypothetical protein